MLVNAVTASLICSPSTEIPLPQCFDVLIKHCRGRLAEERSRAPLHLSRSSATGFSVLSQEGRWDGSLDDSKRAKNDGEWLGRFYLSIYLSVLFSNLTIVHCKLVYLSFPQWHHSIFPCVSSKTQKHVKLAVGQPDSLSLFLSPSLPLSPFWRHPIKQDPSSQGLFSWVNMRVTVDLFPGSGCFYIGWHVSNLIELFSRDPPGPLYLLSCNELHLSARIKRANQPGSDV